MPLELHPMQESDFPDFVRITSDAFKHGGGMTALLAPDPLPPNYVGVQVEKHVKALHNEPDIHYIKIVDTDLNNAMIAGARWRINEKERTEEQIQSMLPVPGPEDEGRPALKAFYAHLYKTRMEYMGMKPFCFLHLLVTDPAHHRRGAGAQLIAWGVKRADEAKIPSFLESSAMGKPLYTRMGFQEQSEVVFDLAKYGLQGTDTNTAMLREVPSTIQ